MAEANVLALSQGGVIAVHSPCLTAGPRPPHVRTARLLHRRRFLCVALLPTYHIHWRAHRRALSRTFSLIEVVSLFSTDLEGGVANPRPSRDSSSLILPYRPQLCVTFVRTYFWRFEIPEVLPCPSAVCGVSTF